MSSITSEISHDSTGKDCILTGKRLAREDNPFTPSIIQHASSAVGKRQYCTEERMLRMILSKWQ